MHSAQCILIWLCFLINFCSILTATDSDLLSPMSECAYSYTVKTLEGSGQGTPLSILRATPVKHPTLLMFNAAFGTTGTRSLFKQAVEQYGSGCHWIDCEPKQNGTINKLPAHFDIIRNCIDGTTVGTECHTDQWLMGLKDLLEEFVTSGITVLVDTPVVYLFSEIRNLVPDVVVQHSLRNPFMWAVKRIGDHPKGDLICADHTESSNPFHILECMENSKYVQDNIVTTVTYTGMDLPTANRYLQGQPIPHEVNRRIKLVGKAYAKYNTFILLNTYPHLYQPVCVWDT